ncbi:glycosyltransferase family 1 protein, partial [Wickerhamomyces anomalus NRRL Y-366-8]
DVARPSGMAKSFVSMLTTASMYNGNLQDIIDEEELNENDSDQSRDDNSESGSKEAPPSLFEMSIAQKFGEHSKDYNDCKKRAIALSEKLRDAFQISPDDIFLADFPCWLLKDVLLQGHIYLTQSHLLFFAFLQKKKHDKVALAGHLSMDSLTLGQVRYWAVLKDQTLSLYTKSTELYFPVLTVDLRYALRAEIVNDSGIIPHSGVSKGTWIRILTESKSYKLQADSPHAARSWVGLLKKHIFSSRNKGDCVTVKVPLQNILDLEETPIFEAAETIKIKVLESSDSFALDDYFFMFFNLGPDFMKVINEAITALSNMNNSHLPELIVDSTARLDLTGKRTRSSSLFPLKKVLAKSRSRTNSDSTATSPIASPVSPELVVQEPVVERYLGPPIDEDDIPDIGEGPNSDSDTRSQIYKYTPKVIKSASYMWISNPVHYEERISLERGSEDEYLASPKERIDATKRFQHHFALSESDVLVASYYAHLQRNVPIYGKVYLGAKEICFRSLVPGFHTKMILPYKDIENTYKEKGFKFGYSGLVVVIHGHEELFFEFSSTSARDDCEFLLLRQLDKDSGQNTEVGSTDAESIMTTSGKLEAAKIQLFEDKIHTDTGVEVPIMIENHPLMKTSVKPETPYRFTLLTIGSRGDVQPYIALGLGLKAEGHVVRIVTHKEFEDWIVKHGLEFKEIAGNPTELMSLMVSHGSMNVGLIKEASSKFRGWITELLSSSWEACQDTDILIESPSAMAGIHIAEALNIPYFRAFTMPWTRTRAYPHAFIVPEQKKGGSYNYLTHVLFENVFWKGISGQVNKWRKETLNLPKTNLDMLQQNKVPFLYNISPTVFPPPVDFNDWIKVTGYWFLNEAITYSPPQELLDFINQARIDEKKLVYIGFGSIVVSNPKELTQAVVDAVLDADVRCILNKGWSERLGGSSQIEIELPYEVFNAGSLPHDWLFPQIDAAVHHGGSGTTGATLRAGLPTIIKPFFADQFFYANRVEDIGVGISLKKLNVKSLSKALKEATTNNRMITKARDIGAKIRKENGVANAIDTIYRDLQYAKELISNKRKI